MNAESVGSLSFITAILPKDSVAGLSYPLPLTPGTLEQERELNEFIQLAIDMGARGFLREDVETCDGMVVIRDIRRLSPMTSN